MRALLLASILLCCFATYAQPASGKKIYLKKGGDGGILIGASNMSVSPGDTLVIRAEESPLTYFYAANFNGTKDKPIVITNEGGSVIFRNDMALEHCQYIKLTGSGSKDKYGFQVLHSKGVAVGIRGKCANIEVERFSAEDCSFGAWVKNEAACDTTINNWVIDNISIHDFKMVNMHIEGFYLGSTDANNTSRPVTCNGKPYFYKPSKLGNIRIYNGIINGTGRPAIMLSNAQVGMSEIYNNTISNVGREYNDQQGSGISLGLYTRAYVHNNNVKNTFTWGIVSLGGAGLIRIENNTVDSSGYLDGRQSPWAQNISIDTRPTIPVDSTKFIISGNTLSNPGANAEHIRVWRTKSTYAASNIICNNIIRGQAAKVVVEQGVKWKECNPRSSKSTKKSWLPIWLIIGGTGLGGLVLVVARRIKLGSARTLNALSFYI